MERAGKIVTGSAGMDNGAETELRAVVELFIMRAN
jgi:hypothetical protein